MRLPHFGRKALDVLASHGRSDWYRISNAAEPDVTDLWIYDEIGYFGTPASEFIDQVRDVETPAIAIHINSLGGDVFDGIAIYNALRQHDAHITTYVDSMAASIASVIAQAGDERVMVSNSQMMIHEAWGVAAGAADDMRKYADTLDKQSGIIADIYAERSGRTPRYFRDLMRDETWMDAEETVNHKLADSVLTPPSKSSTEEPANDKTAAKAHDWSRLVADVQNQELFT